MLCIVAGTRDMQSISINTKITFISFVVNHSETKFKKLLIIRGFDIRHDAEASTY